MESRQQQLMTEARTASSFNPGELTCLIYGDNDTVRRRRDAFLRVETLLGTRNVSTLPRCYASLNREEMYREGLKAGRVAFEDTLKYKHDLFLETSPQGCLNNASPFGLVRLLFEPTIQFCGSEEQKAYWLPLSRTGKILGTYCQTELGHGTFVRGIETTATYDEDTDEFVVHSPTPTSTKFWPGGLGYSATHAVVMARLVIASEDHGPHFFIVQLRSVPDGLPLPGIKLGDVGLKMAYNGTDNGFATFSHARIPRTNMLMGHAKVERDGSYSSIPDRLILSYSAMLKTRIVVARVAGRQLAQVTTIAIRYSTVREQGGTSDQGELSIIRYRSQHFRLLTLVAKSYGIMFAMRKVDDEYKNLQKRQEKGNRVMLPYLHILSAGMKAWATQEAADGAEDARKCCGGHGLLMMSGLPEIVASATAACTFEGDNYVMWQQVGRYLLKCMDTLNATGNLPHPDMLYLRVDVNQVEPQTLLSDGDQFLDRRVQLSIFQHRARRLVSSVHSTLGSSLKAPLEAWNRHMMSIISAARAHIEYTVLQAFSDRLVHLPASVTPSVRLVLERLCSLFALSSIINPRGVDAASFFEDGHLSLAQLGSIRNLVNDLLDRLVPDAIALTDAWDFTDATLSSALGMRDGDVYGHLLKWTEQLPINQRAWTENQGVYQPGWAESVAPILRAKI